MESRVGRTNQREIPPLNILVMPMLARDQCPALDNILTSLRGYRVW